ncbi:MAG TPA: hypothetical protein VMT60_01740 [Candidatus Bathyarchaeia archaeon]|nr:hypothetical protein [Candidatus Bathyarchaeia archaeon]
MKRALFGIILILSLAIAMSGPVFAQCHGTLMLASNYFEFDYLVRLAVHFGDAASIPSDIICSRSMLPSEVTLEAPIWAYNLQEGIQYLEFSVVSNESLAVFVPDNCFSIVGSCRCNCGGSYRIDLAVQACGPLCGPVRVGSARIVRVHASDPVWVDLRPNSQTGKMFAMDMYGKPHNAFSPRHGGYFGMSYLYACQPPICEEPNATVTSFVAERGPGCSVRLTWTAGSGNRTMIRFRTDQYPTGTSDGQLAVEVPSTPGQSQYFYHTGFPSPAILYYKAFSLTRDAGGLITRDSFVECSAVDSVTVKCEIAAQPISWGAIKSRFK